LVCENGPPAAQGGVLEETASTTVVCFPPDAPRSAANGGGRLFQTGGKYKYDNGRDFIMTSTQLETITDHLAQLHGYAFFRPETGALRDTLVQTVLDAVEGEAAEELAEANFDLEVSIRKEEGDDSELAVSFSVDHPGLDHTSQVALSLLSNDALQDLDGYLSRLVEAALPVEVDGKAVLRKINESDHHEKGPASARLKVSPEWLKSVIPCTDYSYEEIEGKKYIREYYWSKELIERLLRIKSAKTTPEDLQYVASECCEGDLDWAKDLIARLKSQNRPEPMPKEQPQRNQGRSQQNQGSQAQNQGRAGQNQGRPAQREQGQGRPAQGQGRSAQGQGRPAQGQGRPAQGQGQGKPVQNQVKPGQNQNQGKPAHNLSGPANVVPSERVRSRSRHKRSSREQGKDGAAKPETGGPTQPQN